MNLRSRLFVTMLEDRTNPSGMADDSTPPPYDPTLPPAQTAPVQPSTQTPGPTAPYG